MAVNETIYDIDPRLPWLVVGVSIMEKRVNSTGVRTGETDPRLLPYSRGSGISPPGRFIFSRHNIKKVASGWNKRRGPLSLDKSMKMDHDNLRKSRIGKFPDRLGTQTRRKQNHQEAAEWDEWPRWYPPVHWKLSPMMKNQQQRLKR